MNIKRLAAKQILDSRGVPTVEAQVETEQGVFIAQTPSGTSCGKYEAKELRDKDGRGVKKALKNIKEVLAANLEGKEFSVQAEVDGVLIGLAGKDKAILGVNAVLPVSIACCRALAVEQNLPLYKFISQSQNIDISKYLLPRPCVLLIEGGKHAPLEATGHGKSGLSAQEFMAVPRTNVFSEGYQRASEVYTVLEKILKQKFGSRPVETGLEGGFSPALQKTSEALDFITQAIKAAGLEGEVGIGIDIAASHFRENGNYHFEGEKKTSEELLAFYEGLVANYPILFLEDPFSEEDFSAWKAFNYQLQTTNYKLFIVGDDLTTTNPQRIKMAQEQGLCNAVIIKPNQIGTVSEAMEAVKLAKGFGWKTIVSHRAGDTKDDFIADFAVGVGADFIKSGGPFKPERQAKYNRLLAIEKELC